MTESFDFVIAYTLTKLKVPSEAEKWRQIMLKGICPKCSCTQIEQGWILSAGKIAFKSDEMPYPFSGGNVRTFVCMECGYTESYVDEGYRNKIKAKLRNQ
ncbi:MAG: hypothetical protein KJ970_10055 [Candidatus Eisenbacteria bacterium]|uniref:Uncharacterized protein n=1 Tax=Eiseniibacteriota bacterium TaxID=2212470 RepID=A0A948RXA8_UNCEI|nr:hypothetical protein [Candidatus Eisenbacteria bacterium]